MCVCAHTCGGVQHGKGEEEERYCIINDRYKAIKSYKLIRIVVLFDSQNYILALFLSICVTLEVFMNKV
jgi:hypothetical protein